MVEKKCIICGKIFDTKGRGLTCSKKCSNERKKQYHKQYRQDNKEKKQEYDKQYYQNNKENILEQQKQYYQDNKEKRQEYQKQYRQDNKEKRQEYDKQYGKQYYQNNKEKKKEYSKQYYQNNKENILERQKQYRQDNKEKMQEYGKQYYQNNKENILERQKRYNYDNKEKIQEYQKQKYEQAYKDLSKKRKISIDNLKSYLPPQFVQRELDCWEQGSYYLDLIIPAKERANGRCEITGKKNNDLFVHHLNGYNWCVEGRMDLNNVVVICRELHDAFHKKYGNGNNTAEQFWEFVKEWEKGLVTLDDFMEE